MMKKKIPPPVLLLICLIFMILLRWIWPIKVFLRYPINLAGLVLVALGLLIGLSGVFRFLKAGTNIHPFRKADKLVTDGVYRFSRNPMYLGLTLILVGSWILLGAISPVIGIFIFFIVSNRYYIPPEEQMLGKKFGNAYEEYRMRVRRWF